VRASPPSDDKSTPTPEAPTVIPLAAVIDSFSESLRIPSPRYKCDADSSPFTLFPPISKPVRPTAEPEKYDDVRDVLLNVRAAFPYNVPSPLDLCCLLTVRLRMFFVHL